MDNPIIEWTEAISSLPDNMFFDMMRLYLGEIKTPYNKQRLIEQLAGFIRNEENLTNIISLIDETDLQLLTAIYLMNNPTEQMIADFFAKDYSIADIYTILSNLSDRLLIYQIKDKYLEKKYLRINPLLLDKLKDKFSSHNILKNAVCVSPNFDDIFTLSADFIFAFICFVKTHGISCKADGSLKKNDISRLEQVFPGKSECIHLLLTAFINLRIAVEGDKGFYIDEDKLELFASLSVDYQYAFICAAASSHFSRDGLKKEAQLFLDCISSIPADGYTRSTFIRLAFLIANTRGSNIEAASSQSRFSRILEAAKNQKTDTLMAQQAGNIIDRMFDCAVEFGLLQKKGSDENGEPVYTAASVFGAPELTEEPKVLNIDSVYTITVMPGLSLKKLLVFSDFFEIKRCGVVSEFEITRQSVSRAFDNRKTPEQIFTALKTYLPYELSQNLQVSISDWYNSYNSARIYQGYVLKVAENNINYVENNPRIKPYLKEKLGEGIYLLSIPANSDISFFIEESGLEFMGTVNDSERNTEKIPFPLLRPAKAFSIDDKSEDVKFNYSKASDLLNSLKLEMDKMEMSPNQKESLSNKIHQRLIVSQKQLKITSIRTEILEVDGMDFAGKKHLISAAIDNHDRMELTLPAANGDNEYFTIVGHPLGLSPQPGDAILRFEVEPEKYIDNFVVSRITHIRRLRF